ncbi:head protein [Pyxidicoccus fallax]|uniref:Head protein n=1 Tax=Pyxidicoccus fallax TaxID=394095 RepID=A0A848LWK9_9BACT|nr:head protein [Pyxidicoccus fallax]NMO21803.1 head protein [Pyxidicoccus fallax]NPC84282.1 head protein [Pyxidicoccus fallax]
MTADRKFHFRVLNLLGRLGEESTSEEDREYLDAAMSALDFISRTGQSHDFEAYRESVLHNAPPLVIATFDTHESAETWLRNHPHPPCGAHVLIAGEYHDVLCDSDLQRRYLPRGLTLEYYLREMLDAGLPEPVATFDTLAQARDWVDSQPEPPRQVVIVIAGEPHLVAYHDRVGVRSIYPLSRAAAPGSINSTVEPE